MNKNVRWSIAGALRLVNIKGVESVALQFPDRNVELWYEQIQVLLYDKRVYDD